MYFFYFDESGSRDPSTGTTDQPKDHLYVLLAVGMYERQWRPCDFEISKVKLELADYLARDGKGKFEHYMREYHPKHQALIVMDDTSKQLNRSVTLQHARFQRSGNPNRQFPRIVEYPFFTRSELSNGVQLADLLAYNVFRAFKDEDLDYPYFKMVLPSFYRRLRANMLDGLKIWPDASPLGRLAGEAWGKALPKASVWCRAGQTISSTK